MSCGTRLMHVSGKTSDMCSVKIPHLDLHGAGGVPRDLGIGGGDYIRFTVCLDCGKIQDWIPKTDDDVIESVQEA